MGSPSWRGDRRWWWRYRKGVTVRRLLPVSAVVAAVGFGSITAPGVAGARTTSYARIVDGSPACVSVVSRKGRPRSAEFVVPLGGGASDWVSANLRRRTIAGKTWWVAGRLGVRLDTRSARAFWNGKVKKSVRLPKIPATRVEELCPSP